MDYEKKYKEALETARKINSGEGIAVPSDWSVCEAIFPELRELEDEKIRKGIESIVKHYRDEGEVVCPYPFVTIEEALAWLEKQGKETKWKPSKEEMDVLYGLSYITDQYDEQKEQVIIRLYQDLKREFFNGASYENMFPTNTSIEDDVRRRSTIQVLEYAKSLDAYNQYGKADINKNIAWLEKQGKEEYALKSFRDKDVHKFMQYIEKQAKAYEFNLPNRSYDIYAFAKDILAWLKKQGEKLPVGFYYVNSEGEKFYSDTFKYGDVTLHVEKQGEQKLSDNDKPEDKEIINSLIDFVTHPTTLLPDKRQEYVVFLENLKENGRRINFSKKVKSEKQVVLITESNGNANIDWDTRSLQDVKLLLEYGLDYIKKLEKQGEQKPANKIEPKFKVGDWVVYYRNDSSREVIQVYDIRDGRYYFTDNVHFSWSVKECDEKCHLWSIQDAKDGDVLFCKGELKYSNGIKYERICLFNNLNNAFFTLTKTSNFVEEYDIDVNIDYPENTVPATKEQKEILFMAMKEAGYEWDAEKKELKKIEQKPAWSEEDEELMKWSINNLTELKDRFDEEYGKVGKCIDWVKSLKQRKRIGG